MAERAPRPRNQPLLNDEEFAARRPELLEGIRQYNDGYFFQAHETWEDLWYPSPWPVRPFLQGLIQLAAAFVHLMRREYPGTLGLLDAALTKIEAAPPGFLGIDTGRLVAEARDARLELQALGPDRFQDWPHQGIPRIHLTDAP
jgi:hypothetical protein